MPYKDPIKRAAATKRYLNKIQIENPARYAEFMQKRKDYTQQRKHDDPRKPLLSSARERAKKFNLPLDIVLEDIIIPEYCPVFKELKLIKHRGYGREDSATLDRIVPSRGYVKGNIKLISFKANRLKSNATPEELMAVIDYMKEHS